MTARRRRWSRPSRLHVRPVALEVARPGQDEVGPAAHGERNIEIASTRSAGRPGADVGFAAASSPGHDQELDRLGVGLVAVGGRGPAVGDSAAVRSLGEMERALPAFRRDRARRRGRDRSPPFPPGPDQIRIVRSVLRMRSPSSSRPARGRRQARRSRCDDLGACSARGLDPEVDDGSTLDDGSSRGSRSTRRRGSRTAAGGTRRARD
jgi:hypothetical protein